MLFVLFEFNVTVGSGNDNRALKITMTTTGNDYIGTTGGNINISNGIISPGTPVQSIVLTTLPAKLGVNKFFMVAFPKNFTIGENPLIITVNRSQGGQAVVTTPSPLSKSGWTYSQGQRYTVAFSIP